MEIKELKITIPEGYVIDKEKSTFERIVFKKKDNKPRSWEEYCDNFKGSFYYIRDDEGGVGTSFTSTGLIYKYKNIIPSKELAEAFIAMMQLMSLRQEWIGDWKPDWSNCCLSKYCINGKFNHKFEVFALNGIRSPLSFPTNEMAEDFMNTFKDLLEIAKPLI